MSYVSLNRRWRPRSFAEVTRQEHVTRTLRNAIGQGRLAQAYLFGGRRGTGKTTLARILAMGLNCQAQGLSGPTAEPCGECPSCQAIRGGTSPDVIELDAASNRGIDEIRALQENVRLSPMSGRYKVYIIDEAHQMTKDAYNAFLKTLEEPPPHVVFVLATTEPEKIIPTVRSRCQRFDFRPVPEADIAGRLRDVAQAEGFKLSDELLGLLARKAEGSLRDALGLLEQCIAFAGESPTVTDFLTVTGGLERDALRSLASLAATGQAVELMALLDSMLRAGRDPGAILDGLVAYLREVFLAGLRSRDAAGAGGAASAGGAAAVSAAAAAEAGPPPDPELVADAKTWPAPRLIAFIEALVKAAPELRYSPQPRLVLEMTLLALALEPAGPSAPTRGAQGAAPGAQASATQVPSPAQPAPATASHAPDPSQPTGQPAGAYQPAGASLTAPPASRPAPVQTTPAAAPAAQTFPAAAATAAPSAAPSAAHPGLTRPGPEGIDLHWFRDNWEELLNRIRKRSVFTRAFLLKASPASFNEGVLTLTFDTQFHKERMEEDKNRLACEEALAEASGLQLRLRCRLTQNGNGNGGRPEPLPEPEPPPEERPIPRSEPVQMPPPAKPQAAGNGGYQGRSQGSGNGGYPGRSQGSGNGGYPGGGGRPSGGGSYPGSGGYPQGGQHFRPAAPGPAPAMPSATPRPAPATGGAKAPDTPPGPPPSSKPPGSETVRSALSIFGGRLVDDSSKGEK